MLIDTPSNRLKQIKVTFIVGTKLSVFHFTAIFRGLILAIFTIISIVIIYK